MSAPVVTPAEQADEECIRVARMFSKPDTIDPLLTEEQCEELQRRREVDPAFDALPVTVQILKLLNPKDDDDSVAEGFPAWQSARRRGRSPGAAPDA